METKDVLIVVLLIAVVGGGIYLAAKPPSTPSIPTSGGTPDAGSAERTAALNTATAGVGLISQIIAAVRSNQQTQEKQAVYNGAGAGK